MPLGQAMLAPVAGPKRMGRVMSIVGVPMLLAPGLRPADRRRAHRAASWRWIFFVNLPVGLLAIALAVRLLPAAAARPGQRLDVPGAVLLSGGLAAVPVRPGPDRPAPPADGASALGPMAAGAVAVALFAWHALRVPNPLIDLRLFRQRGFAAGTAVNLVLGIALFGVALLLPLYFEIAARPHPAANRAAARPARPRRGHHHQPGRLPDRPGRRPPGGPRRRPARPGRHGLVHPDQRAHPLLGAAGRAVPDRRRPGRHHHPGHGRRLPGPAATPPWARPPAPSTSSSESPGRSARRCWPSSSSRPRPPGCPASTAGSARPRLAAASPHAATALAQAFGAQLRCRLRHQRARADPRDPAAPPAREARHARRGRTPDSSATPGPAATPRLAALRGNCMGAAVLLIVQFGLGIGVNLYVTLPWTSPSSPRCCAPPCSPCTPSWPWCSWARRSAP